MTEWDRPQLTRVGSELTRSNHTGLQRDSANPSATRAGSIKRTTKLQESRAITLK